MQNIERLAYWALLLTSVATLFLSGHLRSEAEAALAAERARLVQVDGLYDAGSGDVLLRVDKDNTKILVLKRLCPKSRSF